MWQQWIVPARATGTLCFVCERVSSEEALWHFQTTDRLTGFGSKLTVSVSQISIRLDQ